MRFGTLIISVTALTGMVSLWGQSTERVVFLSGEVRLEDGTPPPDAVVINRVCSGRTTLAAYSDSRGHFGFSVDGGSNNAAADAGQPPANSSDLTKALNSSSTQYSNPITTLLRDCEVQLVLSGFRTESVRLTMRDTADDGRLGTIILHPLSRSSALTVSATTAAAPSAARKAYDKALEAMTKEKWEAAEADLTQAVKVYPKFAIAWFQLGQLRLRRHRVADAVQAWNEARQQDPKYIRPFESLATLADQQGDWVAAEQASREWLQLDPDDYPSAYLINAIANARLNRPEVAEAAARAGLRLDKDRKVPRLNYVLGLILMQKQQFAESANYLRAYLELAPNARDAAVVREQVAKLEHTADAGPPH